MFETLKTLGCERIFGLHRLHRRRDLEGFETTYLKERANITNFLPKPAVEDEENIKVVWGFNKCKTCDKCKNRDKCKHCLHETVKNCWSHCRGCHNCKGHKIK